MYQRILLAYDGSVEGRTALREGAILAKQAQARVYLLSVVAESTGVLLAEGAFAGVVAQDRETYRTILEAGVARLQQLGLEPVAELRVGEPGHEIASFALEVAADLVVVGHRRRSGLQRWWAAGAGVHLLDQLDCSLLIARHDISDNALRRPLRQREVDENQTAARAVDVGMCCDRQRSGLGHLTLISK